ncbi:uncharacterized protein LY89DRAFT_84242 [Mollisia scopiformis]|uniref:Uncharacterized protein n=1 Tax=Mollisia scopiformis TaxID=149040 RepID=A0A194X9M5_MOLSC|nr:uncharacterized protein LY89DRAFT_84242 [Mollisia scopiformis]KUJ16472.1 hypothetical protein LY89DRAFT_84242 [Mollisia scopiformis]
MWREKSGLERKVATQFPVERVLESDKPLGRDTEAAVSVRADASRMTRLRKKSIWMSRNSELIRAAVVLSLSGPYGSIGSEGILE